MQRRKLIKHGKEVGLKMAIWSEDDTQFPAAWEEAIEQLQTLGKSGRVIGFKCELWLSPDNRDVVKE